MKNLNFMNVICLVLVMFLFSIQGYSQIIYQDDVIIEGALEVDTMLNLDYMKNTNIDYLRKIGVDNNGNIIVLGDSTQYNYQVNAISDILSLNVPNYANITVKTSGAKYCVQKDSISGVATDTCVIVKTNNNKYAILQPRDRGYYIEDFGAIPDDGIDDQPAIQKAINAVIYYNNWRKSSKINAGGGVFNLSKGVVIADKLGSGEYELVTFTLSGNISCYSDNQGYGKTTVFSLSDSTFCLAVQEARNCVIENIMFKGNGIFPTDIKNIVEWENNDWRINAKFRMNRNSPSCAIAIDPFDSTVTTLNRYPNNTNYYTNYSNGGSSMLTIRGCAFNGHYIAIANNPSNRVQNGDNIRVENSNYKNCYTFWACGQTQSRSNSIDNIYGYFLHTFIDGYSIGDGQGTPPVVSNVNLAGFTKQLLNVQYVGYSPTRISKSYFEAIWSLGYATTNNITFTECQIKFKIPSNEIFAPPYHLYSGTSTVFRDCSIEYFANCDIKMPILFKSSGLLISGGWIEGGVVVSNGHTNSGGDDIHNVTYENVWIKCLNRIAGIRNSSVPIQKTTGSILLGGEEIGSVPGGLFKNNKETFNHNFMENVTINIDSVTKTANFITGIDADRYQIGDNIFSQKLAYPDSINMPGSGVRSPLGYISTIAGDTITITGIPYGFSATGTTSLYVTSFPIFIPPIWGDFVSGNDTIFNVNTYNTGCYPPVGYKMYNAEIPTGSFVKYINLTNNYIVMSAPALSTKTFSRFYNAFYQQTIYSNGTAAPTGPANCPYIDGCIIYLNIPQASYYGFVCTQGGVFSTSNPPLFTAITY